MNRHPRRLGAALIPAVPCLAACAASSVQSVGTSTYAPLPANAEVVVYTAENEIKKPYDVVGIVSYNNPGKYQVLTLANAIEPLKAKAREIVANAIVEF